MTEQCCVAGPASRRLARWLSAPAAILPGAVLVLLPKCPLCLAAWLTVVTGVGFSAAGAAWVRGTLVVSWIAAVALAIALWRCASASSESSSGASGLVLFQKAKEMIWQQVKRETRSTREGIPR
jgi:hypothetical protein